jgi:hypothetical protein
MSLLEISANDKIQLYLQGATGSSQSRPSKRQSGLSQAASHVPLLLNNLEQFLNGQFFHGEIPNEHDPAVKLHFSMLHLP